MGWFERDGRQAKIQTSSYLTGSDFDAINRSIHNCQVDVQYIYIYIFFSSSRIMWVCMRLDLHIRTHVMYVVTSWICRICT